MNHFIALFVLITLALSQDNTGTGGVVKADCTKEGACSATDFFTTVMCTNPTTGETYKPEFTCVNSPKDPSVCIWDTAGCPVISCVCDKTTQPEGTTYLCNEKTETGETKYGGPICITTPEGKCEWGTVTCLDPYVEKKGFCPVPMSKDNVFCAATTYGVCTYDSDCEGTKKCCKNECNGLSCQEPNPVIVRPGICPAVKEGEVSVCGSSCEDDGGCGERQKCCPNGCQANSCVTVIDDNTPNTCDQSECPIDKPVTFASTYCNDGSFQGPFCEPNYYSSDPSTGTSDSTLIRKCEWTFHPCPPGVPDIHKGSCPIFNTLVACDPTVKYESECESDKQCILSHKCCWDGCRKVCCDAVADDTCAITGDNCWDKATAEATANSAASDSILPGDDCYYRCQQNSLCSYDPATLTCSRDAEYKLCLKKCLNPDPTPVDPICAYKTSCDCMADTKNACGWCQVKAYTTSTDGKYEPCVWGICSPPSGTNLCSASKTSGGYEGSFCTVAPAECIADSSVDTSNIKDQSTYFTDPTFKEASSKINTGKLTETDVQKVVDNCGCEITIKRIFPCVVNTEEKAEISSLVEVHTCDKSLDEICQCVVKGFTESLGLPDTSVHSCKLKVYSETAGTSVKRAAGSTSYIQSATVDPATVDNTTNENSAGTLAPIWMMLFAIFLFFRM